MAPSMGSSAFGESSGSTMNAVMSTAFVNEYLRCVSTLKRYQAKHGFLPSVPVFDQGLDYAERLLAGLRSGEASTILDASSEPLAAAPQGALWADVPTVIVGTARWRQV